MNKILTEIALILFIFLSFEAKTLASDADFSQKTYPSPNYILPKPETSLPNPQTSLPAPHISSTRKLRTSGFYFGADVGYQEVTSKFNNLGAAGVFPLANVFVRVETPFVERAQNNNPVGNLYLGYLFKHKQLFFGIDGFLSLNNRNGMFSDHVHNHLATGGVSFEIRLEQRVKVEMNRARPGIEIRPGININDRFSLFLLFGMLYNHIKMTNDNIVTTQDINGAITIDTLQLNTAKDVLATQFGLGILFAITPDVYLSLMDRYTIYPEIKLNSTGSTTTAFGTVSDGIISENNLKIYNNNVLIGLLFKFS